MALSKDVQQRALKDRYNKRLEHHLASRRGMFGETLLSDTAYFVQLDLIEDADKAEKALIINQISSGKDDAESTMIRARPVSLEDVVSCKECGDRMNFMWDRRDAARLPSCTIWHGV